MACETIRFPEQTPEERAAEISEAMTGLERQLADGTARLVVDPLTGAVGFDGWRDRRFITDACAFNSLDQQQSPALAAALWEAQAQGLVISREAIARGVHTHDGGQTWSTH